MNGWMIYRDSASREEAEKKPETEEAATRENKKEGRERQRDNGDANTNLCFTMACLSYL